MSDLDLSFQMLKPAPLIWAHFITPRPERKLKNGETIAAGYEGTFLLGAEDVNLAPIKTLIGKAAASHEKIAARMAENKAAGRSFYDGIKLPLENGTAAAERGKAAGKDREFLRGMAMLKGMSGVEIKTGPKKGQPLSPPRLVALQNGQYVRYSDEHERALAKKFFYSGVLAVGTFNFAPWSSGMGMGVKAYINEILSLNAGEKINTGADDEAKYGSPDTFKGYVGHVSSVDPTAGAEQIPW